MKKSCNIHGIKVPIKTFKPEEQTNHLMGYCTKRPLEIFINQTINQEDLFSTIIHEMTHAIIFRTGMDQVLSWEMQELLCENISHMVQDNFTWKK